MKPLSRSKLMYQQQKKNITVITPRTPEETKPTLHKYLKRNETKNWKKWNTYIIWKMLYNNKNVLYEKIGS